MLDYSPCIPGLSVLLPFTPVVRLEVEVPFGAFPRVAVVAQFADMMIRGIGHNAKNVLHVSQVKVLFTTKTAS